MPDEIRAKVPAREWSLFITDDWDVDSALDAAADALHVYRHAGVWDGGVQLSMAMRTLAERLEPLIRERVKM